MKDITPYAYGSHMMWTDPYISQKKSDINILYPGHGEPFSIDYFNKKFVKKYNDVNRHI